MDHSFHTHGYDYYLALELQLYLVKRIDAYLSKLFWTIAKLVRLLAWIQNKQS